MSKSWIWLPGHLNWLPFYGVERTKSVATAANSGALYNETCVPLHLDIQ